MKTRRASPAQRAQAELELRKRLEEQAAANAWPAEYLNNDTGKTYQPHHDQERRFVYDDTPRYGLLKGGEGGGKSVAGIVKALDRLKRGMSGIMVSPDLQHFKRSLWPEFRRWCPWQQVVARHQYRGAFTWEPAQPFMMAFETGAVLYCGGIEDPSGWEGPNVSFAHFDEARRKDKADALKVLDGRVRIPWPNGEPPQLFLTTTPRKHWLFEYFGPLLENDPRADFKRAALVVTLLTADNAANLSAGFVEDRAKSLTSAEARVLLNAEWEDIDEGQRFLPSMVWWDQCKETLPPLTTRELMVVALDAATGRVAGPSDCFGLVGITRHPDPRRTDTDVAVRYVQAWQAPAGGKIDFQGTEADPGPERVLRWLCETFNVACVVYDPTQLHDMATRMGRESIAWFREFKQGEERYESDRQLYDLITQRRLAHDGNPELRQHVDNADRKLDNNGRMRLVKREEALKIDLAVCTAMGAYTSLRLNI